MFLRITVSRTVICLSFCIISFWSWKSLHDTYLSLRKECNRRVLFKKRHNCVVMYSSKRGLGGWWPHLGRIQVNIAEKNCLDRLYEPLIYFFNTAEASLDVAVMMINVKQIFNALLDARKRGVKIRVLLNFEHSEDVTAELRNMIDNGIEVQTYIYQSDKLASIMHYKYAVKDVTDTTGYVFMGSLNMTNSAFLQNYENIVFTSNKIVVNTFHENFEQCWNFVKLENRTLVNRAILSDANLC